jgi:hypothetical protein
MKTARYKSDATNKKFHLAVLVPIGALILTLFTGCAEIFHGDSPKDPPPAAPLAPLIRDTDYARWRVEPYFIYLNDDEEVKEVAAVPSMDRPPHPTHLIDLSEASLILGVRTLGTKKEGDKVHSEGFIYELLSIKEDTIWYAKFVSEDTPR